MKDLQAMKTPSHPESGKESSVEWNPEVQYPAPNLAPTIASSPAKSSYPVQRKALPNPTKTGLPHPLRNKMEVAFRTDFSDVELTTNSQKATALKASAFATGSQIHFAPGAYQPGTNKGDALIGHELTHVVQQRQGRVNADTQYKGSPLNTNSTLEDEADLAGAKAARGESVYLGYIPPHNPTTFAAQLRASFKAPIQMGNALGSKMNKHNAQEKILAKNPTELPNYLSHKLRNIKSPAEAREVLSWFMDYGRSEPDRPWKVLYRNAWNQAKKDNPAIGDFPNKEYGLEPDQTESKDESQPHDPLNFEAYAAADEQVYTPSQIVMEKLRAATLAFTTTKGIMSTIGKNIRGGAKRVSKLTSIPGRITEAIDTGVKTLYKDAASQIEDWKRPTIARLPSNSEEESLSEEEAPYHYYDNPFAGQDSDDDAKARDESADDLLRGKGDTGDLASAIGKRAGAAARKAAVGIPMNLASATSSGVIGFAESGTSMSMSVSNALIARGMITQIERYRDALDEISMTHNTPPLYRATDFADLIEVCKRLSRNRLVSGAQTGMNTGLGAEASLSADGYGETTGSQPLADAQQVEAKDSVSELSKQHPATRAVLRTSQQIKSTMAKSSRDKDWIAGVLIKTLSQGETPQAVVAQQIMIHVFGSSNLSFDELRDLL